MRLELPVQDEEAAERGRDGWHEAEADQAEQVPAVVGVEASLGVWRSTVLRFQLYDVVLKSQLHYQIP